MRGWLLFPVLGEKSLVTQKNINEVLTSVGERLYCESFCLLIFQYYKRNEVSVWCHICLHYLSKISGIVNTLATLILTGLCTSIFMLKWGRILLFPSASVSRVPCCSIYFAAVDLWVMKSAYLHVPASSFVAREQNINAWETQSTCHMVLYVQLCNIFQKASWTSPSYLFVTPSLSFMLWGTVAL